MIASKLERELGDVKHQVAVEKSMRVAVEERLLEEHRVTAKLEQTTNTKIEVSSFVLYFASERFL